MERDVVEIMMVKDVKSMMVIVPKTSIVRAAWNVGSLVSRKTYCFGVQILDVVKDQINGLIGL